MKNQVCRLLATPRQTLPPVAGKYPTVARDHEYIRYGTWSILAGLDLQDGHITARVEERHRSVEFIALLKDLDTHYPPECTIRRILDNLPPISLKRPEPFWRPARTGSNTF